MTSDPNQMVEAASSALHEFDLIRDAAKTPDDLAKLERVRRSRVFNYYRHSFAAYIGCTPSELEDRWVLLLAAAVLTKPVADGPRQRPW